MIDVKNVQVIAWAITNRGSYRINSSQVLPGLNFSLLQEALARTRHSNQSQVIA